MKRKYRNIGVYYNYNEKKWNSYIRIGRLFNLGYYQTEEEAARVSKYIRTFLSLHGLTTTINYIENEFPLVKHIVAKYYINE